MTIAADRDPFVDDRTDTDDPASLTDASLGLLRTATGALGAASERTGQVEMVKRISFALARRSQVSVKAGTGTGKTLGYLCPVIAAGKRALIVVSSIALQDQLRTKDLPFLESLPGVSFEWAVLKGRSRYLCQAKMSEAAALVQRGTQFALFPDDGGDGTVSGTATNEQDTDDMTADVLDQLDRVNRWARDTTSGDLSELDFEPTAAARKLIVTGADECPGRDKCDHGDSCYSERARSAARAAQVVVINTALLGADLVADGTLLGPADVVVVDEAHDAEDALANALGTVVTPGSLLGLASSARAVLADSSDTVKALRAAARDLETSLADHAGERFPLGARSVPDLVTAINGALLAIAGIQRDSNTAINSAANRGNQNASGRAARLLASTNKLFFDLEAMIDDPGNDAVWVDSSRLALHRVPVHIGSVLATRAWQRPPAEQGDPATPKTVVLTSATLPEEYPRRLGLARAAPWVDVGSPFDHRTQSVLYVPELPLVGDDNWFDAAWAETRDMICCAEGRTLALFTSIRNMTRFAARARETLAYPVLVQNEAPKQALTRQFRDDESSCLFATTSFWTGIDVPGPSLSLVIIDKIAFPRPDDPLWVARREAVGATTGSKWHYPVDVPRAAASMAQAAGRLVRSNDCGGVIMVLDPRLAGDARNPRKWSYRKDILAEMPPARRMRNRRAVMEFLAAALGRPLPPA